MAKWLVILSQPIRRVIWGVCGGLAKYFNIDTVIVRIIAVASILWVRWVLDLYHHGISCAVEP